MSHVADDLVELVSRDAAGGEDAIAELLHHRQEGDAKLVGRDAVDDPFGGEVDEPCVVKSRTQRTTKRRVDAGRGEVLGRRRWPPPTKRRAAGR